MKNIINLTKQLDAALAEHTVDANKVATLQRELCAACTAAFSDAKPGDDLYIVAGHSGTGTEPDLTLAAVFAPNYTQAEAYFVREVLGISFECTENEDDEDDEDSEDDNLNFTIACEGDVLSLLQ